MSYFFPITAELVAGTRKEKNKNRPLATSATLLQRNATRTRANPRRSNVASVATSPVLNFDWRELFEERAAIREHDGGLSRADAEAGALFDLAQRWRAMHPLPASLGATCVHCGEPEPCTPMLARGGHAWLHRACWAPMDNARRLQAEAAIRALLEIA